MSEEADKALASVFREEWPRLIGAALRILRDLQAAEDIAAETLLTALDRWPLQGVPDRPGAWLMTVCRNRARNAVRDEGRARQRAAATSSFAASLEPPDADPDIIADDRLRLIALCCHPMLTVDAQVALTLRMVGGLTTEEIARGFHLPAATIAQRIVRAKRRLKARRADFSDDIDISDRLPAVLDVIYLVFNEGYLAAAGETLTRGDLAFEAYRLACLVTELTEAEPQSWALRALLSFQLSRWSTRTDSDGALLTLDVQDRSQWNAELIRDGVEALARARVGGHRGPLLLQAELAACHATAPGFDATDWAAIVALYDELTSVQDTPVVALNRAVAVSMLDGPAAGIAALETVISDEALRSSHRVWAVRADLHRRLANNKAAIADYDRALELVANDAERRYLAAARSRIAAETRMPGSGTSPAYPSKPFRQTEEGTLNHDASR